MYDLKLKVILKFTEWLMAVNVLDYVMKKTAFNVYFQTVLFSMQSNSLAVIFKAFFA